MAPNCNSTSPSPDYTDDLVAAMPVAPEPFGSGTTLWLSVQRRRPDEVLVVATGDVDLCTAPALRSRLGAALRLPGCRTLIVDLRGVRFLGARGIVALMAVRRAADAVGVRLAVVADHRTVLRPLQLTGAATHLALVATVDAARGGAAA